MEKPLNNETPSANSASPANPTNQSNPAKSASSANPENPANPAESPTSNGSTTTPKKPRFRIRGSFIGFLAGALIIIGLLVNSCVFSSQVGALSVQVNTSDPAIEQVEVGVYKGIASEVLTDDKPDNDPEALCTITVDTNSTCTISEVSKQGTYTLMVKPVSGETAYDQSDAQFQSPKPQIINLKTDDVTAVFELEGQSKYLCLYSALHVATKAEVRKHFFALSKSSLAHSFKCGFPNFLFYHVDGQRYPAYKVLTSGKFGRCRTLPNTTSSAKSQTFLVMSSVLMRGSP